jgi:hypothetical protein
MLGKRKKIAKFLTRTLTYRSTFLYDVRSLWAVHRAGIFKKSMGARHPGIIGFSYRRAYVAYVVWRAGTKTLFLLGA